MPEAIYLVVNLYPENEYNAVFGKSNIKVNRVGFTYTGVYL
jgi:hypothetical protein